MELFPEINLGFVGFKENSASSDIGDGLNKYHDDKIDSVCGSVGSVHRFQLRTT